MNATDFVSLLFFPLTLDTFQRPDFTAKLDFLSWHLILISPAGLETTFHRPMCLTNQVFLQICKTRSQEA